LSSPFQTCLCIVSGVLEACSTSSFIETPTLIEHIMLDRQVSDETQGSQRNEQVVKVKPFQEPHSDHKATDQENACCHCADIPGNLHRDPVSELVGQERCGRIEEKHHTTCP
jgi:hypothetical protein